MPKALSWDLKWRVVWQHLLYGWTAQEISRNLFIGLTTVYECIALYKDEGVPYRELRGQRGPDKSYGINDLLTLNDWLEENCDLHGDELVQKMSDELEFDTSPMSVCRMIHDLGDSRKKVQHS
jgi:transposase